MTLGTLIIIILIICHLIFDIISIKHVIKNQKLTPDNKGFWVSANLFILVVIFLLHFISFLIQNWDIQIF